ncbi:MAG: hypothetical protein JWP54_1674, partial [Cryobacterium sp.]|nr:hypothetical protein [Cryobacterium sp.]
MVMTERNEKRKGPKTPAQIQAAE